MGKGGIMDIYKWCYGMGIVALSYVVDHKNAGNLSLSNICILVGCILLTLGCNKDNP